MLHLNLDRPDGRGLHLLALGAHADDIEIGAGGTVLRLVGEGVITSARWVVLSGTDERAREARSSAAAFLDGLGDREVEVGAFRDGYFPSELAAIKDVFEGLKEGRHPDLILAPRREDLHQDHRVVADLTWQTFRDHLILEYEIAKYEGDLATPNVYVQLPEVLGRRKVALLLDHFNSQAGRSWFTEQTLGTLLRVRGLECNAASGLAEGFTCRKAVL